MATGITRQKRNSLAPLSTPVEGALGIALQYEGKKAWHKIVATPAADLRRLWPTGTTDCPSSPNRLYFGDNLGVLAALRHDPAVCGKIRLIYIDPPYATGGSFQSRTQLDAYDDLLMGAPFVEFLRERLILLRELLADDGSIYVHLDKNMAFAIKIIMDEVFGPKNFRSWITRKKCNPKNYTSKSYGNVADFILFYTKTDNYVWHRPYEEWTDVRALKEYSYIDANGRRYKKVPVHAPGVRNGETGQLWRGVSPPPGKHWQYLPSKLDELDAQGHIYWSPTGNPRRKVYLDESEGIPIQDIWTEFRDAHNQNIEISGFPTEKNPALLRRIIEASSNPGDLVLDCFSGSGTALAVASQNGRHWIGVDNSPLAIGTTLRRFACGLQPMGDFVSSKSNAAEEPATVQLALILKESRKSTEYRVNNFALFQDTNLAAPTVKEDTTLLDVSDASLSFAEYGS